MMAGLNHKFSEVRVKEYNHVKNYHGCRIKRLDRERELVSKDIKKKNVWLTCRSVSLRGNLITGMFTEGSVVGFAFGAPA
jgi:hypothetical protein